MKEVAEITYDNGTVRYADIGCDSNLTAIYDVIAVIQQIKPKSKAIERIERGVYSLPSAQPETAKRIVGKSRDGMTLWYQCDMCNEPVDAQDNFCRGCGRRLADE